jgi:hypothetical protein
VNAEFYQLLKKPRLKRSPTMSLNKNACLPVAERKNRILRLLFVFCFLWSEAFPLYIANKNNFLDFK